MNLLICPQCKGVLSYSNDKAECIQCGSSWSLRNGIPVFDVSAYWGEIPQAKMVRLNALAQETGWRSTLKQIVPWEEEYVASEERIDGISSLIPLRKEFVVLDIGAGLGGISCLMAKRVRQVVALEAVFERAEFIDIRRRTEEIANLQVIAGTIDAQCLPPASFDVVILNGVLEWVALLKDGNPRDVQKQVLLEVRNLLRPGGWIYIGIENRFSATSFLGEKDHSGLPFTNLMPRWLASLCLRAAGFSEYRVYKSLHTYRTYTYSYWGYERLLKDSGFSELHFLGTRSYNSPRNLFELSHSGGFHYIWEEKLQSKPCYIRIPFLLLSRLQFPTATMLKLLSPSFCISGRNL